MSLMNDLMQLHEQTQPYEGLVLYDEIFKGWTIALPSISGETLTSENFTEIEAP